MFFVFVILLINTSFVFTQKSEHHNTGNKSSVAEIKRYLYYRRYQFAAIGGFTALAAYLLYLATKKNSANDNQNNRLPINNNQEGSSNNNQEQNINNNNTNINSENPQPNIVNEEKIETFQEYLEITQEKIAYYPNKVKNLFEKITREENKKTDAETLIKNLNSGDRYFCKNILDFKNNQDAMDLNKYDNIIDQETMNLAYLIRSFPLESLLEMPIQGVTPNMQNSEYISIIPIILNFLLEPADTDYTNEVVSIILHLLKREIEIEGQRFKENGQTTEQIAEQWFEYFLFITQNNNGKINYHDFTLNQFIIFTRIMFLFQQAEKQFLSADSKNNSILRTDFISQKLKALLSDEKNISTSKYISIIPTILSFLLIPDENYDDEAHAVILNLLKTEIALEYKTFKENDDSVEEIAHRWAYLYFSIAQGGKPIDCSHLNINQFVILVRMFFCEHEEPHLSSVRDEKDPIPLCRFFAKELISLLLPNKEKNIVYIRYLLENLYPLEYRFNLNNKIETFYRKIPLNQKTDKIDILENYEALCKQHKITLEEESKTIFNTVNTFFSALARNYKNLLDEEVRKLKEQFLYNEKDPKKNRYHSEKEIPHIIAWLNTQTYHLQQTEIECCTDFTKLFYIRFNDLSREIGKNLWKTLIKEKNINIAQEKFDIALASLPFYKKNEALDYFLFLFVRNLDLYVEHFIDQEIDYKNLLQKQFNDYYKPDIRTRNSALNILKNDNSLYEKIIFSKRAELIKKIEEDVSIKINFIKNLNNKIPISMVTALKEIDLQNILDREYTITFSVPCDSDYEPSKILYTFKTNAITNFSSFHNSIQNMLKIIITDQINNNCFIQRGIGNKKIQGIDWSKTHIAENLEYLDLKDEIKTIITDYIIKHSNYDDTETINLQTLLLTLSEQNKNDSNFTIKKCFESYRNFILFTKYSKSLFNIVLKKMINSTNLTDNEKSILLQYCFYNNDIVSENFLSTEIIDDIPYLFLEKYIKANIISKEKNGNLYNAAILINNILRNQVNNIDEYYETEEEKLERIKTKENSFLKPFIPLSIMIKYIKKSSNEIINATGYKSSPYGNISNVLQNNIQGFLQYENPDEHKIVFFGNIYYGQTIHNLFDYVTQQDNEHQPKLVSAIFLNKILRNWLENNNQYDNLMREIIQSTQTKKASETTSFFKQEEIPKRILIPIINYVIPTIKDKKFKLKDKIDVHCNKDSGSYDKKNHKEQKKNLNEYQKILTKYLT